MLRQNSLQPRGLNRTKTEAELLEEAAEVESLRAAYLAVAGQSGRVVSGSVMKEALHSIINTVPVQSNEAIQIPVQLSTPSASQDAAQFSINISIQSPTQNNVQTAAHVPIQTPGRTFTTQRSMVPIDEALQAIADVEADLAAPYGNQNSPSRSAAIETKSRAESAYETANAKSIPAHVPPLPSTPPLRSESEQPTHSRVNEPTPVADAPQTAPVQRAQNTASTPSSQASSTASVQSTVSEQISQTNRAVKLPKFLVGQDEYSERTTTQPGSKTLPPVPQDLFSDLKKPAAVESNQKSAQADIERSNTFQKNVAVTTAEPSTAQPVKQFFDTTSSAAKTGNGNQSSFASFLNENPATPTLGAGEVPIEGGADWVDKYQRYESVWVKLFERPKLLLGVLGLGIVSCSVYIALGYWWFGGSPISQAAEPVSMLNVQEGAKTSEDSATSTFNNIRTLQKERASGATQDSNAAEQDGALLAQATPASGLAGEPAEAQEPVKSEPTGRVDPFAPLVSSGVTSPADKPETKKDILEDLQYTGFIGDISSKDKVAIIKVSDSVTGSTKTLIKKAGEALSVDGEMVTVRGISKRALLLSTHGEYRELGIQQYQAVKPTQAPAGNAGPTDPNAPPSGAPGSFGPGGSYGPGYPGGSTSAAPPSGGRGPNVSLREPSN